MVRKNNGFLGFGGICRYFSETLGKCNICRYISEISRRLSGVLYIYIYISAAILCSIGVSLVFGGGLSLSFGFIPDTGFNSGSNFHLELGFNNTAYAIQNYSLTLSSNTAELSINIDALPESNVEVLTHNLTLNTNNPNGARVYLSAKNTDIAPKKDTADNAIQPAIGTFSSPAKLSNNTFGFAVGKNEENNNDNMISGLENFSEQILYTSKSIHAKYARLDTSDHMREIYQTNKTTNNSKILVYYGANVNSLLDTGKYTIDVIYTVISNHPAGGISENDNNTLDVNPKILKKLQGGETVVVSTNIKTDLSLNASDISFKINNKPCTGINITQNIMTNGLVFSCNSPQNSEGKYNVSLQITKQGINIANLTKYNAVQYKRPIPTTVNEITHMQEFTSQMCYNMSEHQTATLRDSRDGENYTIAKLKDHKCWMTQNLRLKLSTSRTLTPQDTDIASSWTPNHTTEVFTTSGGTYGYGSGTDWGSDEKAVRSGYRPDYYSDYGVYYSHSAAVADSARDLNGNSDEASDSICPKGWRLPQITNSEFYYMAKHYKGSLEQDRNRWSGDGIHIMTQNPPSFLYPGHYFYNSAARLGNLGISGVWWSSTVRFYTKAYALLLNSDYIDPQNSFYRLYGFSVRCLAR